MTIRKSITSFAIAMMALIPTATNSQVTEGVAAIVNDQVISTFDVRQRIRLMILSTQVQPTEESLLRFQQQAIRALVDENLKLQEAGKFEISITKGEVDQQIARIARQNDVSADSIRADLRNANISPRTLEDQIRSDIAWQVLISSKYGPRVRVSNNQIEQEQARFEANLAKPQYLISEILLESPSVEQDGTIYNGGLQLIEQMQKGAPFIAVAQQFSAAPSARQGGDMGWIQPGDMPSEVDVVLQNMQVGTMSNPIKVPGGYYIVAMRDRKEGGAPMVANFRQIVAPMDQFDNLVSYMDQVGTCADADSVKDEITGAFVNPFDDVAIADLAPAFREILETLQPKQWSQPIETPNGAVIIMLCDRHYAEGSGVPSSEEIVDRLTGQRLAMLARRYLRDLRRDSTIEYRN